MYSYVVKWIDAEGREHIGPYFEYLSDAERYVEVFSDGTNVQKVSIMEVY